MRFQNKGCGNKILPPHAFGGFSDAPLFFLFDKAHGFCGYAFASARKAEMLLCRSLHAHKVDRDPH